jgi:hypothetical protein
VNAPAPAQAEIVSKSEFARLSNVTPGRVTQWITERKIHGDAIVGEGRAAQIHVARARAQLRLHLDIGQRMGNGLSTTLDGPAPAAAPSIETSADAGAQVLPFSKPNVSEPVRDPIEEQIKRERLETARRTNRKMAEEEAARNGRYVLAEVAAKQVGKAVTQFASSTDGWLAEMSSAISAKFGIPQRDVLHLLRSEYNSFRGTLAGAMRQQAAEMPEIVEDELAATEADDEIA